MSGHCGRRVSYIDVLLCRAYRFLLYANDTTLFRTIEYAPPIDSSDVNDLLNREISLVYEWSFLTNCLYKKDEINAISPISKECMESGIKKRLKELTNLTFLE